MRTLLSSVARHLLKASVRVRHVFGSRSCLSRGRISGRGSSHEGSPCRLGGVLGGSRRNFVTAAFVVLAAAPLMAHHAFNSEFDANRPVKFRGTVTKMDWVNPHAWIHLTVKKPDG